MKNISETKQALNAIRNVLDQDVSEVDISDVKTKLSKLSALMGLSAEAIASAKKHLHEKELEVFAAGKVESMSPSIAKKYLEAKCKDEIAMYEYADRIGSAVTHCSESLRTIISLYKEEMKTSMHQ
jgi:hypothetical protein